MLLAVVTLAAALTETSAPRLGKEGLAPVAGMRDPYKENVTDDWEGAEGAGAEDDEDAQLESDTYDGEEEDDEEVEGGAAFAEEGEGGSVGTCENAKKCKKAKKKFNKIPATAKKIKVGKKQNRNCRGCPGFPLTLPSLEPTPAPTPAPTCRSDGDCGGTEECTEGGVYWPGSGAHDYQYYERRRGLLTRGPHTGHHFSFSRRRADGDSYPPKDFFSPHAWEECRDDCKAREDCAFWDWGGYSAQGATWTCRLYNRTVADLRRQHVPFRGNAPWIGGPWYCEGLKTMTGSPRCSSERQAQGPCCVDTKLCADAKRHFSGMPRSPKQAKKEFAVQNNEWCKHCPGYPLELKR